MLTAEFVAKPAKPFRGEIVTKEFHRVRIRQIQCGITIETRQPGTPFLVLQKTNNFGKLASSGTRVLLYGLQEISVGSLGTSKDLIPFFVWFQFQNNASEIYGEGIPPFR